MHQRRLPQQLLLSLLLCSSMLFIVTLACAQNASGLPDPRLTPGRVNSEMTEELLHASCHTKGWTRLYRPPVSFTNSLKRLQMRKYGYENRDPRDYEEDHLVPLCLGGASEDPGNLWPEPRTGEWNAAVKDKLEAKICSLVCAGRVPLHEAQHDVATNWIEAYKKYVEAPTFRAHRYKKSYDAQ